MKLRLTAQTKENLSARAAQNGQQIEECASELIEQALTTPNLDDLLAPLRAQVAASGMSDDELDAFHEDLRNKAWREKRERK